MIIDGIEAIDLDLYLLEDLQKAKKSSKYVNSDKTFKGGFNGCVAYQMESKGLAKENAKKLCAYIGRKAGKIK